MIVERFLRWVETAPVSRRAEAANALSRSYLYSALSEEERDGVEAAMTILLDDPSAQVRFALADALAASDKAPHHIILSLAADQVHIAAVVAQRSPLLLDAELVDQIATREPIIQLAIASRPVVSRAVAAALSEVGGVKACLALLENGGARIARFSLDRIVERFGDDQEIRGMLLQRSDLPIDVRQVLVSRFAENLKAIVCGRRWISKERAEIVVRDARDRATVSMAFQAPATEIPALVRQLIDRGELTPSLLVRAVVSGQTVLFEEALTALSGLPASRISGLIQSGRTAGLKALLERARLPESTFPVFTSSVDVIRRLSGMPDTGNSYRRATYLIDAIVSRCQARPSPEIEQILALLRRLATEAKRDAARGYVSEMMQAA